jgi:hypothetical protein
LRYTHDDLNCRDREGISAQTGGYGIAPVAVDAGGESENHSAPPRLSLTRRTFYAQALDGGF